MNAFQVKWNDEERELVDWLIQTSIKPELHQDVISDPPAAIAQALPASSRSNDAVNGFGRQQKTIRQIVADQLNRARTNANNKGLSAGQIQQKLVELDELYAIVPQEPEPSLEQKMKMIKEGRYRELIPFLKDKSARSLTGARDNILDELA